MLGQKFSSEKKKTQVVEGLGTDCKENSGDVPSPAKVGDDSVGEKSDKKEEAREEYSGIGIRSCMPSLEQAFRTAAKSLTRLCESESVQPADMVAWLETMDKSLKLMKELKSYSV